MDRIRPVGKTRIRTALLLFLCGCAAAYASGDREDAGTAQAVRAAESLPSFTIDAATGDIARASFPDDLPAGLRLWDPAISVGQIQVGNRVYPFSDVLNTDLTGEVQGLAIEFSADRQEERETVAGMVRVHIRAHVRNTTSRARTFALRYVMAPHTPASGRSDAFAIARIDEAPRARTIVERETDLNASADTRVVFPVSGQSSSGEAEAFPFVGLLVSPDMTPAQISLSNRTRLLDTPWTFRTTRSRPFALAPGAPADPAFGIRFGEVSLAPDEDVELVFVLLVGFGPEPEPEPQAEPDLEVDSEADLEPVAEPDQDTGDRADAPTEQAGQTIPDDDPSIDVTPAEDPVPEPDADATAESGTETEADTVRAQDAFRQLAGALDELRALQRRSEAPSREELDEVRATIERLRRELDTLRRSDTQE